MAVNRGLLDELSEINPATDPTIITGITVRVQTILIDCRLNTVERTEREARCLSPESYAWSIDWLLERVPLELSPIPSPTTCLSPFCDGDKALHDHTEARKRAHKDGALCSAPCAAAAGLLGLGLRAETADQYLCPFLDCDESCDTRGSMDQHISTFHQGFESDLCDSLGHFWGAMVAIRTKLGRWPYLGEIFGQPGLLRIEIRELSPHEVDRYWLDNSLRREYKRGQLSIEDRFAVFHTLMKYRKAKKGRHRPPVSEDSPVMDEGDACEYARRCAEIPVQADHEADLHFGPVRQICFLPETNEILSLGEDDNQFLILTFPSLSRSSEHTPCPLGAKSHVRSFSLFPPDQIMFARDDRIISLQWPGWADCNEICKAELPIDLVCTDATGEMFAFATENQAFIHSNSWVASVDSVLQTDEMNTRILFLEFGPICNTLVICTADAAVHVYNPAIYQDVRTIIPARSVPRVCVPRFNAESNLLLVDEGMHHKKLQIINFSAEEDTTLDLPERVFDVIVIAATTSRIAFAQRLGAILICEFDWGHVSLERTLRGDAELCPISQMTWADQSLIAGDDLGKIHVWTSLSEPVQLELQVPPPDDEVRHESVNQTRKRPEKLTLPKALAKCSKATGDEEDILEELEELSDGIQELPRDLVDLPFEPPQADRSMSGPFFITLPQETAPVLKKGVPLSDAEMELIITMHSHNKTWTEIGRVLRRPESTCREFWNHHNERGGTFRAPRGRPKKRPEATTKVIVEQVEKDRRLSVRAAAGQMAPKTKISPESVRVQRHENGIHFYKTIPVPPLSDNAKAMRVQFCQERLAAHDHRPIIFTDESTVGQDMYLGGIWRHRGEFVPEGTYEVDQHPISVMVWGAIGPDFRSQLIRCPPSVNGDSYIKMLAGCRVFGFLNQQFGEHGYWWQQDNAPPHKPGRDAIANVANLLGWPPHSPDLSPIEHAWADMKRALKGRFFANEDELFAAVSEAWEGLSMGRINKLYASFLARCQVCIELGGACLNGHWGRVTEVREEMERTGRH
jgi:hypothetical protein